MSHELLIKSLEDQISDYYNRILASHSDSRILKATDYLAQHHQTILNAERFGRYSEHLECNSLALTLKLMIGLVQS